MPALTSPPPMGPRTIRQSAVRAGASRPRPLARLVARAGSGAHAPVPRGQPPHSNTTAAARGPPRWRLHRCVGFRRVSCAPRSDQRRRFGQTRGQARRATEASSTSLEHATSTRVLQDYGTKAPGLTQPAGCRLQQGRDLTSTDITTNPTSRAPSVHARPDTGTVFALPAAVPDCDRSLLGSDASPSGRLDVSPLGAPGTTPRERGVSARRPPRAASSSCGTGQS
jgi:hypothetical protein